MAQLAGTDGNMVGLMPMAGRAMIGQMVGETPAGEPHEWDDMELADL
jgi:hypothetical protein